MVSSDKKNDLKKFITKDINLWLTRIAGTMLPSVTGITLESLLPDTTQGYTDDILVGGLWNFFLQKIFFRTTRELEYFFFLSRREFFFLEFNIRLYDKNSEADLFLLPPESEYFFSNIGNQNIFFRKYTHPFKLNGRFLRRAWGYQGGNQNLYMKNRQHNGQRKKDKKTIYKTYT